jgi:hypothetical protein
MTGRSPRARTTFPPSGRGRIDWDAAYVYYAGLGAARSFGKVARKFGVSDVAVGKHAAKHGWESRAGKIDAKTRQEVEARVVRDRAARLADTINLVDEARLEVLDKLESGDIDVKISDLSSLIKLELLIEHEVTDWIETTEVRQVIATVFEIAGRFVAPEQRPALLEALGAMMREMGCEEERSYAIEGRGVLAADGTRPDVS